MNLRASVVTALASFFAVGCALENPTLRFTSDAYPVDAFAVVDSTVDSATDIAPPPCTEDSCSTGQYCVAATGVCASGCRDDGSCAGAPLDGGAGDSLRCDLAAHRCVQCLANEHCPAGTLCVAQACVAGCSEVRACPAGRACCGGVCVDSSADVQHCGGCDRTCRVPSATAACRDGACAVATCAPSTGDCNGLATDGCETDTASSPANCGACGHVCETTHGTAACVDAACAVAACTPGFGDCDAAAGNGCEVETRVSAAHCGACGHACATPPNAVATCAAGVCGAACVENYGDCDGNAANGCETDLRTSQANCGACAHTGMEMCDGRDNDCDGLVDEGFSAVGCISLACSGSGVIHTARNDCLSDHGLTTPGDTLQVYCVGGVARFCLSGEACPWRSGTATSAAVTCSRAGLAADPMGEVTCDRWNGRSNYACDAMGRIYFP